MPEPSLEDRVHQYTLERFHEAIHGKNGRIVGKRAAWLSRWREARH